jgi:hypothetical protein
MLGYLDIVANERQLSSGVATISHVGTGLQVGHEINIFKIPKIQ